MRRLAYTLPLTAAAVLLIGLNAARQMTDRRAPPPRTALNGAIVLTDTTSHTTRPLRRDEVDARLLPADLPPDATDIQFASYAEWQAYELFVTFRAPPATCLAYAKAVLDSFNKAHPDRAVTTDLTPIANADHPLRSSVLPVAWFNPDAITSGFEAGAGDSHRPKVWVDTANGAFYYRYTD